MSKRMKTTTGKSFMSISRKVWVSLSIMIIGYLASMIFGFIMGIETEKRLQRVSDSVFPAALLSKAALTEFDEQGKLYKDAVVFGESSILDKARERAKQAQESLSRLYLLLVFDDEGKEMSRGLLAELGEFTVAANGLYARMLNEIDNTGLTAKAQEMTAWNVKLRERLTNLTDRFSKNLKRELVNVAKIIRNQRYMNMVVFFIVVSISLILVSIIIFRSVTRPLQKAVALAGAMADGDHSQKLDIQQRDEIGELARAMNIMAEKIEESQTQLEYTVAERTASLEETNQKLREEIGERERTESELKKAQEKLLEAARHAEEANKSKSEFLANMSHEIRTPLTGVIGMTEILMNSTLSPEQQDYVETIKVSGETLLSIINDILDISKIEAGEFSLAAVSFNLEKSIEGIARIFAPLAQKKGLEFRVICQPEGSYQVYGDEVRVRQIIFNLAGNALKFTNAGKIEIRVKPGETHENIGHFYIDVEDTGIGIEPKFMETIFNKFAQADSSNTRKYGGTGLGLYISRQLVDLMGGAIGLESTPGKGSVFRLVLPMPLDMHTIPADVSGVGRDEEGVRARDTRVSRETPLNILLVEDNKINQKLIMAIIKNTGHQVDIAENGLIAVERAKSRLYNLVLMDVQMPEMNGIDATKAIRSAGLVELPIIAMTASAFEKDKKDCLDAGMNDFITKPLKQAELFAVINKYG